MVAFLANGIILLFVLVIAAIVGICKLIYNQFEKAYWKKRAEEERAQDPEAWDARQKHLREFIEHLDKDVMPYCH